MGLNAIQNSSIKFCGKLKWPWCSAMQIASAYNKVATERRMPFHKVELVTLLSQRAKISNIYEIILTKQPFHIPSQIIQ